MESSGKTTDNLTSRRPASVPLPALGVLRFSGRDGVSFLQGQLSNDMTQLSVGHSLLAGYHNPQGRVIALLRLIALAPDELLAIVPRELAALVVQRLSRFILRAKVKISDDSAAWRVDGIAGPAAGEPDLPQALHAVASSPQSATIRVSETPARWLRLSAAQAPAAQEAALEESEWRSLVIAAGEPQVWARTSEEFVAQMLNLDVLGAIAFQKGCYTGQEVIARAHYRGRVKRRMQRFRTLTAHTLSTGDSGTLADGRSFKVIEATVLADGRCEFLAVAPLGAESASAAPETLAVEPLTLPYPLPE
jgi:tRNA-modifying protein YgfZ